MTEINLDRLFNPESLAMIGASDTPGKWGFIILMNILKGGFRGRFYPVNPKRESILGVPCYPCIADVPGPVDAVLITTPAHLVSGLIDECGAKGVPYAVVVTSDFSEAGPEGARLEREIVAKAAGYGMRVIGPNTMGLFSSKPSLHALMPPVMPLRGSVSMFSQSGNVGVQMLGWGINEGVGFEKFISSGNEGDLNCEDYLAYFAHDPDTRVILAYIEGVELNSRLVPLARRTSKEKPILVFKGGRTEIGRKAAASHSGSMAGSAAVYSSVFRQTGMIEAPSSQGLMDCAKAFAAYPIPKGYRVGILTRGGGWGVITADACEENGLIIPKLPEAQTRILDGILPKYWNRDNPVDMVAVISEQTYLDCLEVLAGWDGIDAVIALQGSARTADDFPETIRGTPELMAAVKTIRAFLNAQNDRSDPIVECMAELVRRTGKPFIGVNTCSAEEHRRSYLDYGVVSYPTPERAVRVLRLMADYGRFLGSA